MSGAGLPRSIDDAGVRVGQVLAGKYRVERVLGAGGMGVVVAATHVRLDQRVAIKMLLPDGLKKPHLVTRFAREARNAARLRSDHVVRVTDVDELESGAPFMVMEYLEGSDLADVLEQRGELPVDEAVDYVLQACEAMAEAHALGMIHRDLKPANLFLASRTSGRAVVKLLDFGISKSSDGDAQGGDLSLTSTEMVIGSPRYMSPEQVRSSKDVTAKTDIWSLGIILYQLLTARFPFDATAAPALAAQIASDPPKPIAEVRPDLPPGLCGAITRCLEKDPKKRFADVVELACAIADFAPARGGSPAERIERVTRASETLALAATVSDPTSAPDVRERAANEALDTGVRVAKKDETEDLSTGAAPSPPEGAIVAPMSGPVLAASRQRNSSATSRSSKRWTLVAAAAGAIGIGAVVVIAARSTTTATNESATSRSSTTTSASVTPAERTTASATPSASAPAAGSATASAIPPRAILDAAMSAKPARHPATAPAATRDPFDVKPF